MNIYTLMKNFVENVLKYKKLSTYPQIL